MEENFATRVFGPLLKPVFEPINSALGAIPTMPWARVCALGLFIGAMIWVWMLKREYVDRVAHVSAPRFAEFWEMDPCEKGKVQQEWERDMTANADTGFLGVMKTDPSKKVAKEMLLDVEA